MNFFEIIKSFFGRGNISDTAFESLKEELFSDAVLAFYDPNKNLQLVTDASNNAVVGALLQEDNDDTLKIRMLY